MSDELSDHPFGSGWFNCAGLVQCPSPNFNRRPLDAVVDSVVIHCISLPERNPSFQNPRDLFLNRLDITQHPAFYELKGVEVSAHFLIGRKGELMQFVSCDHRAWHAGVSAGMGRTNFNDFSIGIELVGDVYSPFEPVQYRQLITLLGELRRIYALRFAFAHSEIAPTRKTDPGPFFDWESIRKPNTYELLPL